MKPKVLVAAPVCQWYDYCWFEFKAFLKNMTYHNKDIFLVDNSKDRAFFDRVRLDFDVKKTEHLKSIRDMVTRDHNIIRDKFLEGDYDYLLMLDCDTIPPIDVIEQLLQGDKDVNSGLYFGNHDINGELKVMPFAWVFSKEEKDWDNTGYLVEQEIFPGQLMKVAFTGMGCVFLSRKVVEKVPFFYSKEMAAWDDRWLGHDVWKAGFEFWCDTRVKCKHLFMGRTMDYHDLKKQGRA